MEEEVKRGPGRPRADTLKKGKPSWKPASLNVFDNLEPGYRYRQMRKDPDNLARKAQEGWEVVSGTHSPQTEHIQAGNIGEYNPLTSTLEGRDWILGRIPEEVAQSRDEYINLKTSRSEQQLTAHTKQELAKVGAASHGEITISSRRGQI